MPMARCQIRILVPCYLRDVNASKSSSPLLTEMSPAFSQQQTFAFVYSFFAKEMASSSGHCRHIAEMKGSITIKHFFLYITNTLVAAATYLNTLGRENYRNCIIIHNLSRYEIYPVRVGDYLVYTSEREVRDITCDTLVSFHLLVRIKVFAILTMKQFRLELTSCN